MIHKSTIQLLRFPFSFFLLPVYLFAVSQVKETDLTGAVLCFIILHVLIYPSSNGFNSYMDRDTGSIGGVKTPMAPTRQLLYASQAMDALGVALAFLVSTVFAVGIMGYIIASRAYSARSIRLKKHAIPGYLTVVIFQGAVTFLLCYHAASADKQDFPLWPAFIASLLIGASYPLTQVYQHQQDREDGVNTISMLLGINGTFYFSLVVNLIAFPLLLLYWKWNNQWPQGLIAGILFLPVAVYMGKWQGKVRKNAAYADYAHAMRMNLIAALCSSTAFTVLLIWNHFE